MLSYSMVMDWWRTWPRWSNFWIIVNNNDKLLWVWYFSYLVHIWLGAWANSLGQVTDSGLFRCSSSLDSDGIRIVSSSNKSCFFRTEEILAKSALAFNAFIAALFLGLISQQNNFLLCSFVCLDTGQSSYNCIIVFSEIATCSRTNLILRLSHGSHLDLELVQSS